MLVSITIHDQSNGANNSSWSDQIDLVRFGYRLGHVMWMGWSSRCSGQLYHQTTYLRIYVCPHISLCFIQPTNSQNRLITLKKKGSQNSFIFYLGTNVWPQEVFPSVTISQAFLRLHSVILRSVSFCYSHPDFSSVA